MQSTTQLCHQELRFFVSPFPRPQSQGHPKIGVPHIFEMTINKAVRFFVYIQFEGERKCLPQEWFIIRMNM